MKEIVDFLTSASIMDLATDPKVLFVTLVVLVAAVIMRWKFVLLLIFGVGAMLAVVRYARLGQGGEAALDRNMVIFVGGAVAVVAVLIYFLFIKGD